MSIFKGYLQARQVPINNVSGETIPARSFGLIADVIAGVLQIEKPDAAGISAKNLVVTGPVSIPPDANGAFAIPATNGFIWVRFEGVTPRLNGHFATVAHEWYGERSVSSGVKGFISYGSQNNFAYISARLDDGLWQ